MDVLISQKTERIIQNFIGDGIEKICVLSDFDKTLTKAFVDGRDSGSLISTLYNHGYLSEEYQKIAQEMYAYYSVIEKDETLPLKERQSAMQERWVKHKQLLIKEGLTKQDIYDAMQSDNVQLREGYQDFFTLLSENTIPLIILSAGWLGTLSIERYLKKNHWNYDNIHLIGNDFIWDDSGKAIGFKEPIIHSLNKSAVVLESSSVFSEMKKRRNVILLGDHLNDVQMIEGFEYENLLKIWFLNKDVEQNLKRYQEVYDMVIMNDWGLPVVNEILEKIFER